MQKTGIFQYVVIGVFIAFIVIGAILFATYKSSQTSGSKPVSITMWGTLPKVSFDKFITEYTANMTTKFSINYTEKDTANFDADLIEALASGTGPDTIILPQTLIARYVNKIFTIPYTTLPEGTFKGDYAQGSEIYLNTVGTYAIPFAIDPMVMYWNRDIFNQAGIAKPPTTWNSVNALVPKLAKIDANKNVLQSAVALGEYRNINDAKEILSTLLLQIGNPIISTNDQGLLENNLNIKNGNVNLAESVLQFYTNFSNPQSNLYSWNRSLVNSLEAFTDGDLAIYFGLASEYTKMRQKNPNLNFDVAMIPQIQDSKTAVTFGNQYGFAILKSSPNISDAYNVIMQITGADAVPVWSPLFAFSSARRDILAVTETNAVRDAFNKSALISQSWIDPNYSATSNIFQEMVESYTTARSNLGSAVSTASAKLGALLGGQ
ncbi:MAG: extracellular solute-binding protein [bacterium]